jgi:Ras GTPase-activating protein 3
MIRPIPINNLIIYMLFLGEAKNLPPRSHGPVGGARDVFCTLSLDQEEIYRTSTIEKTLW